VQESCSIDDLGERNEYIRTGTKWNDVIANLDKLQSLKWIHTSVCQTISWMNAYYLPEFHEFMAARGLHVHMNFVHDPQFLSVAALPQSVKHKLLLRYKNYNHLPYDTIAANFINSIGNFAHGIEYNTQIDKLRNTSFEAIFSEFSEILRVEK